MKIGFVLFEDYFQRKNIGSSRIRGQWLIEKMENAERFVQGKPYDVIIFQKAYWREMARGFAGIKIVDICDPDWFDGAEIVNFIKDVDGVTTSTEKLAEDIRKFTDKPVMCIPDRVKFEELPQPKKHVGKAKKVCWFGYSHNAEVLDPTYFKIKKNGLKLILITDTPVRIGECETEFVKWEAETVNDEIQKCDFVLLPKLKKGRYQYKSDNKTIQSWALGMPVAETAIEMDRFMDATERQNEADEKYAYVKQNCDVAKSVTELEQFIEKLKQAKK